MLKPLLSDSGARRFDMRKLSVLEAGCILLVSTVLFITAAMLIPLLAPEYLEGGDNWHTVTILVEIGCFLVPGALYALTRRVGIASLGIRRCTAGQVAIAIMMAFAGYIVIIFIQLIWLSLIGTLGGKPAEAVFPAMDTPARMLLGVVSIAVSAAVAEEFLFRGVLLPALSRRGRTASALLVTSLLFMLMHTSVESLPFTLLYGLLLGWLALRSGSIWPSVAFHAANNAIQVLLLYASQSIELPPELIESDPALIADPATLAYSLLLYGVLAALGAGAFAALAWGYRKITRPPAAQPGLPARAWHYTPIWVSAILLVAVLLARALQLFGVLGPPGL